MQADRYFLVCAQAACPELVQHDCARFADEVERLLPTVTFVARDAAQNDLPDTSVYVDGTLVASELGDGKARPIDPGRHQVRFVHAGREAVIEVVVVQGEKGRAIVGAFPSTEATPPAPGASPGTGTPAPSPRPAPAPARPRGPSCSSGSAPPPPSRAGCSRRWASRVCPRTAACSRTTARRRRATRCSARPGAA